MILRVVSAKTLQVYEVEDVSQVVVFTEAGDPCLAAHETPGRTVLGGHAGEDSFAKMLSNLGIKTDKPVSIMKGIK